MKHLFLTALTVLILIKPTLATSFQARVTLKGSNQPAAQALIVFSLNGVEKARNITGDDGLCFIPDIPEGTYHVKISYRGRVQDYANFVVPAAKYDFEI
jgi:hypothetical protein